MRIVYENEWNGSRQSLEEAVEAFKQAKEAHKFTENVPAPMAEEIVEELASKNIDFTMLADLPVEPPAPEVDPRVLDQLQSDRWVLNELAKQFAAGKDAPEFVLRHAARLEGSDDARTEARPA